MSLRKMNVQYLGNCLRLPVLERDVILVVTEDGLSFRREKMCEWILEHSGTLYDKWRCSECGYLHVSSRCDAGATDFDPKFCPECGRRVER